MSKSLPLVCLTAIPIIGISYVGLQYWWDQTHDNEEPELDIEQEQKGVLIGGMTAVASSVSSLAFAKYFISPPKDEIFDLSTPLGRMGYTVQWDVLLLGGIFCVIATVANMRYFNEDAIRGGRTPRVEKYMRILQNTLEQAVLGCGVKLALSSWISEDNIAIIPALCMLWITGRMIFAYGYSSHESAGRRALGFGLTFYPTVAALVYVTYQLITKKLISSE